MTHRPNRSILFVAALGVTGVVAAACGGSSSGGGPAAVSVGNTGQGAGSGAHAGKGVTVEVKTGPMGQYLTDAAGHTLYRFASDTGSTSTCNGSCSTYWPPLLAKGQPKPGSGASASDLGTSKRSDGTSQVTYAGHPVYYYVGDHAAGDTKGQGLNLSGGLWWMVAPSGANITSGSSSSGSSSSGGYGGY